MSVPQSQTSAYLALSKQLQTKLDELIERCHLFWAYNNEQFEEGKAKHPLDEGDKYVRIASGGILPKKHLQEFMDGFESADKWFNQEIETAGLQNAEILYQLQNHECFYTGSIESAMDAMDGKYDEELVRSVYHDNYPKDS